MTSKRAAPPEPILEQLATGHAMKLEDLVDRESLREVIQSFVALFGISVRIYSVTGELLTDAVEQQSACNYINDIAVGRTACTATISTVKRIDPGLDGQFQHPCFTGARYMISSLTYDGRAIGKIIIGPYVPAELTDLPASLTSTVPDVDPFRVRMLLTQMPRARAETITSVTRHMGSVLDLILFSGHKAYLTSQMHLATVRESYREQQDKNVRLQEAYDKLRELDRLKSNFIATVSHELRTPLTSIIGYSEMLDEGIAGSLSPEQGEFVKTIREKGEQLLTLIMSLLDLSKLESGTLSLSKAEVDVQAVLRDVLSLLLPSAHKKHVRLVLDDSNNLPPVRGDANKLRQAFLNLAENAVKFTPENGEVRLSAALVAGEGNDDDGSVGFSLLSPASATVEARIIDTGIGIPEPEREKVFDPFYQVDSSSTREFGGTGLGLAIVRRLVEAHNGNIRIESNEPNGTVFVVSFPAHQKAD